jgi:C-5 cytosine-specific DNA methylase
VKPLAIDLFCGLGGWTQGLLAEGYYVVGFDVERHDYGMGGYPAQLVLQDVLAIHGKQFKDASLIVASPPCQEYSYMAMPWSKAKAIAAEYRSSARDVRKLTALFDACFRIQREAIEAAGHFIPLVVENVRGAIPWVGRSRWNYGSFHLWGDVPALMPMPMAKALKVQGFRFDGSGKSFQTASIEQTGVKNNSNGSWFYGAAATGANSARGASIGEGNKTNGHVNKRDGYSHTRHLTNQAESDGIKCGSKARKAASAEIAKIPLPLARHIAKVFHPDNA